MPIQAVQHIRRMRGGAQGHLMRCSDGHYYVVKFQNIPYNMPVYPGALPIADDTSRSSGRIRTRPRCHRRRRVRLRQTNSPADRRASLAVTGCYVAFRP
jgi:hypothetical protein